MTVHVLEARNISKTYPINGTNLPILHSISLSVAVGEFLVIKGQSGSGKSTLLSLLSGLDRPDSGSIQIDQVELKIVTITPVLGIPVIHI